METKGPQFFPNHPRASSPSSRVIGKEWCLSGCLQFSSETLSRDPKHCPDKEGNKAFMVTPPGNPGIQQLAKAGVP